LFYIFTVAKEVQADLKLAIYYGLRHIKRD